MKDIINETFKKHLKLLRGRLNENFDEDAYDKVDKFIKNAVMADSQMELMKNRDSLILIVKTFMEAIGRKPYSDTTVENHIDAVMSGSSRYVSRRDNPDIVTPGIGGKTNTSHMDVEDDDDDDAAGKRLGYNL
jgi:hypothetical protein